MDTMKNYIFKTKVVGRRIINGGYVDIIASIVNDKCKVVYHPFHQSLAEAKHKENTPLTLEERRELGL